MKREFRLRTSIIAVVAVGCATAAMSASAQTTSTSPTTTSAAATKPTDSGGVLTSASTKAPATTATRDMINEAIQRSKMRSERSRINRVPERFGSEDPFVFDPTQ